MVFGTITFLVTALLSTLNIINIKNIVNIFNIPIPGDTMRKRVSPIHDYQLNYRQILIKVEWSYLEKG